MGLQLGAAPGVRDDLEDSDDRERAEERGHDLYTEERWSQRREQRAPDDATENARGDRAEWSVGQTAGNDGIREAADKAGHHQFHHNGHGPERHRHSRREKCQQDQDHHDREEHGDSL